jgi:serine phosphatase RsbU (regulator of sigma subunit)
MKSRVRKRGRPQSGRYGIVRLRARRLRIHAASRPASRVGGDLYEVTQRSNDVVRVAICDVCGKGVGAAKLAARIRPDLRRLLLDAPSPGAALRELNRIVVRAFPDHSFVTAACADFDVSEGTVIVASAGHVPLIRRGSTRSEIIGRASGPPLGVLADCEYEDERVHLEIGDCVLFMTDGVLEAVETTGAFSSMPRLSSLIAENLHEGMRALEERILEEVGRSKGGRDDRTLVGVQLLGPAAPNAGSARPALAG